MQAPRRMNSHYHHADPALGTTHGRGSSNGENGASSSGSIDGGHGPHVGID